MRLHLLADEAYQAKLLRFVENHDEPRLAALVSRTRQQAITVATLFQTGARLVHQGQEDGWQVHLPVFLGRHPPEAADPEVAAFHRSLLGVLADPTFRHGRWQLCERSGWEGNDRAEHLVAWSWVGETRWLVVVNLSDAASCGHVRAPWADVRGRVHRLVDPTQGVSYERDSDELCDGLYVELGPWSWHLFWVESTEPTP